MESYKELTITQIGETNWLLRPAVVGSCLEVASAAFCKWVSSSSLFAPAIHSIFLSRTPPVSSFALIILSHALSRDQQARSLDFLNFISRYADLFSPLGKQVARKSLLSLQSLMINARTPSFSLVAAHISYGSRFDELFLCCWKLELQTAN